MITNIINATITAYCSCKLCCGPNAKGICANGKAPVEKTTIAASRAIPLGSKVFLNGHEYRVDDRLAKRYDSRFDIYFESHEKAKQFGIKTQEVKVIIR